MIIIVLIYYDNNSHGKCIEGVCSCAKPYFGVECNERPCMNNCSNAGICENG
jgi:hypothetical protein